MVNSLQRISFHQFTHENVRFLLRTMATILAVCTLLLLAACSTQNTIVTPSPGTWKVVHSTNPGSAQNNLNAISATSATDAWAVGSFSDKHLDSQGAKALIEHWNGSVWSVVTSPAAPLGDSILNGVAALSPIDAWAVGDMFKEGAYIGQTLIEHWNGTSWGVVASPNFANGSQLTAVTALSATDIWAVGYGNNVGQALIEQTLIEHWNGKAWTMVQSPNPGNGFNALTGLAAISTNDIWVVGNFSNGQTVSGMQETLIEHWNGTTWTVVPGLNPGTNGNVLSAVAAVSPNDVWAVGSSGNNTPTDATLIEHWNGTAWSTVKDQNPGQASNALSGIVMLSSHDIWAVGSSSNAFAGPQAQALIEHWNGSAWSTIASPNIGTNTTTLDGAVLMPHSTRIWAVGTGATYGDPVNVPGPNGVGTTQETPVTAQTLIESCCS